MRRLYVSVFLPSSMNNQNVYARLRGRDRYASVCPSIVMRPLSFFFFSARSPPACIFDRGKIVEDSRSMLIPQNSSRKVKGPRNSSSTRHVKGRPRPTTERAGDESTRWASIYDSLFLFFEKYSWRISVMPPSYKMPHQELQECHFTRSFLLWKPRLVSVERFNSIELRGDKWYCKSKQTLSVNRGVANVIAINKNTRSRGKPILVDRCVIPRLNKRSINIPPPLSRCSFQGDPHPRFFRRARGKNAHA